MYFFFVFISAVGGYMAGRGLRKGDVGVGVLGLVIAVIGIIACEFIGFPL